MVKTPETHSQSTENKILEAAKKVFILHGLEGTSMQQIASEAGINKSLLHYYFRTKEKLFDAVFTYAFHYIVPQMEGILSSDSGINDKIERIVTEYMDMLSENKFIPAFILHEINRNPDRLYNIMQKSGIKPEMFVNQFVNEIQQGNIRPIDPRQLIINILSMCIFPVAARPLIQRIFFGNNENAYRQFLEERKKVVSEFIIQSIKP
ncbi:MAG: TetR/AcrR family transcriptional regulator [Bacteroidales bacterium]|nr:TetR/AcrR family transcriptional regulator [Bacteroidales bacterium]